MTPSSSHAVRAFVRADLESVRLLWGHNVLDDLEVLSYDRWGPGIAVPVREGVEEVKVQTLDPKDGMTRLLEHLLVAEDSFCLVVGAVGDVDGYICAEVRDQGVNDFRSGRVTELYVRDDRRRQGLGSALLAAATAELRARDAWVFTVEVPTQWAEGRKFWESQRWEQDALVFRLYD